MTLDIELENDLKNIATIKGLSVDELLHEMVDDSRAELEAVKRADESYSNYLKTGSSISHEQMKANDLDG